MRPRTAYGNYLERPSENSCRINGRPFIHPGAHRAWKLTRLPKSPRLCEDLRIRHGQVGRKYQSARNDEIDPTRPCCPPRTMAAIGMKGFGSVPPTTTSHHFGGNQGASIVTSAESGNAARDVWRTARTQSVFARRSPPNLTKDLRQFRKIFLSRKKQLVTRKSVLSC
jgi:hypothetical protein